MFFWKNSADCSIFICTLWKIWTCDLNRIIVKIHISMCIYFNFTQTEIMIKDYNNLKSNYLKKISIFSILWSSKFMFYFFKVFFNILKVKKVTLNFFLKFIFLKFKVFLKNMNIYIYMLQHGLASTKEDMLQQAHACCSGHWD